MQFGKIRDEYVAALTFSISHDNSPDNSTVILGYCATVLLIVLGSKIFTRPVGSFGR